MVLLPVSLSGFILVSFSAIGRLVVGGGLGKGRGEVAFLSGFILGVGLGTGRGEVAFWSGFFLRSFSSFGGLLVGGGPLKGRGPSSSGFSFLSSSGRERNPRLGRILRLSSVRFRLTFPRRTAAELGAMRHDTTNAAAGRENRLRIDSIATCFRMTM